jgi:hypothetical protein
MKKSFLMYADGYDTLKYLSDDQLGKLTRMMFEYFLNGKSCEPTDPLFFVFNPIKMQMDRDSDKYSKVLEVRREAGKKGGEAKATKSYQMLPNGKVSLANVADKDTVTDTVTDTVKVKATETVIKSDSIESIPTFNFENLESSYLFKKQNEIDKLKIFNDPEVNIAFNDYLKHRISIKKYPSKNAIKLLVKRIREECGTNKAKAIEAMQASVMNNWTSIVFDRNNKFTSSKPQQVSFNRSSTEHYK